MDKKFKLELYKKDTQKRPSKVLYFSSYENMNMYGLSCTYKDYQCLIYFQKINGKYCQI